MNKLVKKITAMTAATVLCLSMAISASAATTSQDVLVAAKENGVPVRYVSELKNYLDTSASEYTADDFDYMIKAMETTANTYLAPAAEKLYGEGTKLSSLTNDQIVATFKSLSEDKISAIVKEASDTAAHFDVDVKVEKIANKVYEISVSKDGNQLLSIKTGQSALVTGDNGFGAVEISATIVLVLAAVGIAVMAKKNKKVEI